MGYDVKIVHSDLVIGGDQKKQIFDIWCEINHSRYNHQKRGGDNKGNCWYSWMAPDYDKICRSAEDVLKMLGFEFLTNTYGDILICSYNDKSGQEELFFKSVAHLLKGYIHWRGEDDDEWTWVFTGNDGILVLTNPERIENGQDANCTDH